MKAYILAIDRSLSIRNMYNVDVYSTDVAGRIGSPISFQCEESFDSANVVIHYNEAALGDTLEENLGVLWYDEESGFYVIQDQAVVDTTNNTVTVELPHFSTYVLVDLDVWNNIEPVHYDVPDIERGVDYYVAFDLSQHMTVQARRNAYSTFQTLVSNMEDEDRVIIFYFDTNYVIDDLYYAGDTAEMNAVLNRVYNNLMGASLGGDYGSLLLPFQITEALINQSVNDIGNARELLIFTNDTEQIHTTSNLNDMLYRKAVGGFTSDFIITENISNGQWNFAWQYAEETDSGYYKYPSCTSVNNSISNYRLVSGWSLDNDVDGIPNVVEEQGILATNGHKYFSDPEDRDPDGDGVSDLEEDGVTYVICRSMDGRTLTVYLNGVTVFTSPYGSIPGDSQYSLLESYANFVQPGETTEVCILRSNPQLPDSDYDWYNDYVDNNPTTTDVITIDLGGGSFDPLVEPDFIGVLNHPLDGRDPSYGGNQKWFGVDNGYWFPTSLPGYINYNFDNYIDPHGCGVIAFNDTSLYMLNGISNYEFETYYDLTHSALETFFVGALPYFGVFYGDLCRRLEAVGRSCNHNFTATWQVLVLDNPNEFVNSTEDMLNRNYPAIMSVNTINSDPNESLIYYELSTLSGAYAFAGSDYSFRDSGWNAKGHYFTVTGLIIDNQAGETFLRVSNAGRDQYVVFSEYVEYVSNHGVIANTAINPGNAIIYFEE